MTRPTPNAAKASPTWNCAGSPRKSVDGWEPDTKVVTGDLYDSDGARIPLCPRSALKRAVAAWEAKHGLTPKVGIELEAFAFEIGEDDSLAPMHAPGGIVYGTGPFADPAGFTDAIWQPGPRRQASASN